jgi:predicted GNAT superfamily acetyltransferase
VAADRGPRDEFRFRRLHKPEEFRALSDVQRVTWGLTDEPAVPPAVQRAIQDHGGLVLGAFADVHLAGFALGFLGWDGSALYHYSHLTAVRPEYQNHHLGIRLKIFQREEVQRQGLSQIRWVFDPLQSRNAMVNLRKLGGRVTGYKVHYFGQAGSELDRGSETDRLTVEWDLASPAVARRLAGHLPSTAEDSERFAASEAIIETEPGDTGMRVPVAVSEPTRDRAHLEIPFDVALVREHEPTALLRWRRAVRDAFRAAFDVGYQVDDFAVVRPEHERRSYYLLSKKPAAPAPAAPG